MGKSRSIPIYKGYESIPINTIYRGDGHPFTSYVWCSPGVLGGFWPATPRKDRNVFNQGGSSMMFSPCVNIYIYIHTYIYIYIHTYIYIYIYNVYIRTVYIRRFHIFGSFCGLLFRHYQVSHHGHSHRVEALQPSFLPRVESFPG